jgi:xanthine dehydrogenase accessory factor
MKNALQIFAFLRDAIHEGQRVALVTLTDVEGSGVRVPGTHMAVAEDGSSVGSFSGGCVEAAVVGEALAALDAGRCRKVRFGAGSPYIDIRLPCGGGMDLLFTPDPPIAAMEGMVDMLEARRAAALELGCDGTVRVQAARGEGWRDGTFTAAHEPDLQLIVLGQGAEVESLARLAAVFTSAVRIFTPDRRVLARLRSLDLAADLLQHPSARVELAVDADTAIVLLFHDHDWEIEVLRRALCTTAFYIGAMGSRATHARRGARLLAAGCTPQAVERIVSPAGLIPASRDPDTMAVSILSQIVAAHGQARALADRRSPQGAPTFHDAPDEDRRTRSDALRSAPARSLA